MAALIVETRLYEGVVEALEESPPVVFVTAYDEYAIRAFDVPALDYLLKPYSRDRLAKAIHRARERWEGEHKLEVLALVEDRRKADKEIARLLEISHRGLLYKLKEYGIRS